MEEKPNTPPPGESEIQPTEPGQGHPAFLVDTEEPLVLAGPPRAVRGEFRLRNPTAEKMTVREAVFRGGTMTGRRAKQHADLTVLPEAGLVMRRVVMRPGQSRPVPVALELDPRTPPGTYQAELAVNDQRRSVVIHVTEDVALQIAPDEIVLANRPGEKVKKTVVFTNVGNVPVHVRSLGTVVLDEELVHCRALRGALSDVGDTMKDLDEFAAALGKRYKQLYETLALRVQNTAATLAPGETQAMELTITLPEKLEARSRYSGYAAISTSSLTFTIVPD
jgi:hypothetical protein